MFVPFTGRRLFLAALALGLMLLPSVSWATTITITAPFDATSSTQSLNSWTISASSIPANNTNVFIKNDGAGPPNTNYFGKLDINNNYLVIHPDLTGLTTAAQKEQAAVNAYNLINDMVRAGFNVLGGNAWTGNGITSTFTQHDPNQTMGIGVMLNDAALTGQDNTVAPGTEPLWGGANSLFGSWFNNTNLSQYDTLVRYTWYGDTLLLGTVQGSDVNTVVANAVAGLVPTQETWTNGDQFYFAGFGAPIDNSDVNAAVASTVFIANGTYNNGIVVTFGQSAAGAAVPEPGTIVLAGFSGLMALFACVARRRRSARTRCA